VSIQHLRESAEARSGGQRGRAWRLALDSNGNAHVRDGHGNWLVNPTTSQGFNRPEDAEYIATFDPRTVLALLDVAEAADAIRGLIVGVEGQDDHLADAIQAAIDRLREVTS
jgi:hypothetical protein